MATFPGIQGSTVMVKWLKLVPIRSLTRIRLEFSPRVEAQSTLNSGAGSKCSVYSWPMLPLERCDNKINLTFFNPVTRRF